MQELTEWNDVVAMVEEEARVLLERLHVTGPPVDAFSLAKAMNLTVSIDPGLHSRGYSRRRWDIQTIMVGSKNPGKSERKQFTIAHEIGELTLAGRVETRLLEDASNLMAVSLLLPRDWFHNDAKALKFDLPALKRRYSTVSHEVIAYRMLDVRPLIITIFDNGRLYKRRNSYSGGPGRITRMHPLEMQCMKTVSERGERVQLEDDEISVTGWPIFRDDWKRVILKTELQYAACD